MTKELMAVGIACLIVWGGLWLYLFSLQRRLDRIEDDAETRSGRDAE